MTEEAPPNLFVNLPVADLKRSTEFFQTLGFAINPAFSDSQSACINLSASAYVMLLHRPLFRSFTQRSICDSSQSTEAIFGLSCDSAEIVEAMVKTAVAAGGQEAMPPRKQGSTFSWSFYDLDGHHWDVFCVNAS